MSHLPCGADDAEREQAYDRESEVGRLDKALDAAGPAGWTVVSTNDRREMFPARGSSVSMDCGLRPDWPFLP